MKTLIETTHNEDDPELTISGMRVWPVEIVPQRPVRTAAGVMASTPLVLVDLETREGIVGCSYVRCYTPLALAGTAPLIADLADAIHGSRVHQESLGEMLRGRFRLLGLQGLVTIALAAVEMAARDARAKARGVKLKVGGGPFARDLEAIWAVRGTIGDGVELMVDYDQSLTDQVTLDVMKLGGVTGWLRARARPSAPPTRPAAGTARAAPARRR